MTVPAGQRSQNFSLSLLFRISTFVRQECRPSYFILSHSWHCLWSCQAMLKVLLIRQLICLQTLPIKASRGRQVTTTAPLATIRRRSARMLMVRHQSPMSILNLDLAYRQSTLFRIGVSGDLLSQALTRSSGTPRYMPSLLCPVTEKKEPVTFTANRSSMVHAGDLPLYLAS